MTAPRRIQSDLKRSFDVNGTGRLNDPGDGEAIIVMGAIGVMDLVSTTGSQTRTLAAPVKPGIMVTFALKSITSGSLAITVATAYDQAGSTVITFGDAGDYIMLQSVELVSGTFVWRVVAFDGVTGPTLEMGSLDVDTLVVDTTSILRGDAFVAQDAPTAEAAGNQVIAAADFVNGIVVHTVTAAATLTTPTGAQITAVLPAGVATGDSFKLHVITVGAGADDISTLTAGDGDVTFVGDVTVGPQAAGTTSGATFLFRIADLSADEYVGYRVG